MVILVNIGKLGDPPYDLAHHSLKGSWRPTQAKRHQFNNLKTTRGRKCRLVLVLFGNRTCQYPLARSNVEIYLT